MSLKELQICTAALVSVWPLLRKMGLDPPQGPAPPLLGMYLKNASSAMFIATPIHKSQKLETTQTSLSKRIDKENVVNLHIGVLLGH